MPALFGVLIIGAGLFSLLGAAFDWDFFMNSYRAQFLVGLIGRPAARVFYGALGIVVIALGIGIALGILTND